MSKMCVADIQCLCGATNSVKYFKPSSVHTTVSKWDCKNCWSKLRSHFKPEKNVKGSIRGAIRQTSYIVESSDKLNRIMAAKNDQPK